MTVWGRQALGSLWGLQREVKWPLTSPAPQSKVAQWVMRSEVVAVGDLGVVQGTQALMHQDRLPGGSRISTGSLLITVALL